MTFALRDYENDWITRILRCHRARRVLVVGPTGSGKTVVATRLVLRALEEGRRILFFAHRRELIKQAVLRLSEWGVEHARIGVVLGGPRAEGEEHLVERAEAPVQVASIQSLSGRSQRNLPKADLVIVDEAHHAVTPGYRKLLAHYRRSKVYGLTATPYRMDGKPLGDIFDALVQSAPPSELIARGYLQQPKVFTVPPSMRPDLAVVQVNAGDFERSDLSRAVNRKELVGSIVEHWQRHAEGRPTVAYAVDLAHGQHIVEVFTAAGVSAELLTGKTPEPERVGLLARLASGALAVLINCEVLTEGWDCPAAKFAIIARPTMSRALWMQMVGRICRPGSHSPIVMDHAGNALVHDLPLEDEQHALDVEQPRAKRSGFARFKACPACGNSVALGSRVCSFCAHEFWQRGTPEEAAGQLELLERLAARRCAWVDCPTPEKPLARYARWHPNCAHDDPALRAKRRATLKAAWADPAFGAKIAAASRARMADPAYRAKLSAAARAMMADPAARAKCVAALNTPEARAKKSAAMASPAVRAKLSAAAKVRKAKKHR